ncbi:protein of unknown function [Maridesulfovibrio hydrothermalis AM13 = DSM 14728]|uniref:Uncharacterized protein n=1 Tax=Maridesulfovibrio hydrothermalis AM13 = DSM 14728 TaxID=1121451 RepID=L0R6D4_9BACT|nr:protein of unknown function [Maridesulfovibrio hydrothermalis AM13 = DSM 14728]
MNNSVTGSLGRSVNAQHQAHKDKVFNSMSDSPGNNRDNLDIVPKPLY